MKKKKNSLHRDMNSGLGKLIEGLIGRCNPHSKVQKLGQTFLMCQEVFG